MLKKEYSNATDFIKIEKYKLEKYKGVINFILYNVLKPTDKEKRHDRTLNLLCREIMNDEYLGNTDPEFSKVVDNQVFIV